MTESTATGNTWAERASPMAKKSSSNGDRSHGVFVLGAGFTRAFLPNAPLLKDSYDVTGLLQKYDEFKHAKRVLELALAIASNDDERVDIERLMTRVAAPTPYDDIQGSTHVLRQLLADVKQVFVERLAEATTSARPYEDDLGAFARCCVNERVNCITFNYDDVLDEYLDKANHVHGGRISADMPRWHPSGGYGFFCKPSEQCLRERPDEMELCSMQLLKLHGSVNWRVRRGEPPPYRMDSLLHHEEWHTPYYGTQKLRLEEIEPYLDSEPFLVPPIMNKAVLIEQPILQHLWATAFDCLAKATDVTFLGYSLPITDSVAGFLFGEALRSQDNVHVKVIVLATSEDQKKALASSYRSAIPSLPDEAFEFRDARDWCNEFVAESSEKGQR